MEHLRWMAHEMLTWLFTASRCKLMQIIPLLQYLDMGHLEEDKRIASGLNKGAASSYQWLFTRDSWWPKIKHIKMK